MPHLRTPSYRRHKATGQAVVTLNGRDHYLGKHGTAASRREYDRLIGEWLARGRQLPSTRESDALTVTELIRAYWRHVKAYYLKNGRPTSEQAGIRLALRPLKRMYGHTPARDFGPLSLKAVRDVMVREDWSRGFVNKQVGRLKRVFRWAVENELVPSTTYQGLQAVVGLRRGRSEARETEPVTPVADEHVEAIRPFVSSQVWAMIELQRLTGMRPGEVVSMCGCDVDTTGKLWVYRPGSHKTQHHGKTRTIYLGPRAQKIVQAFLTPDLSAYLFSAREGDSEHRAIRRAMRQTPLSCGNRPGTNRKRRPKRKPRNHYTVDSYRRAITRACDEADAAAKRERNLPADAPRVVPKWHPHQLRHSCATRLRKEYGIEAARVVLGHASSAVTEVYAATDQGKAREIMAKIG